MLKSLLLKSLFELSNFTRKTSVKINFFKNQKDRYFLLSGCTNIIFGLFWTVLYRSVFSKKCMFATLVNIRQKL